MKLHHILPLAALLALPASAQELRTSYFMNSSTSRHEMNPAYLVDKPYVSMPLLLGNFNVGTTGNFGLRNFVYKMQPGWQGYGENGGNTLTTFMHPEVNADQFLDGLHHKNRLSMNLKYQLAGVAFRAWGGTNSVELNLRSNTNMALPKSLFELAKRVGDRDEYNLPRAGFRTESFAELALGHARRINDDITVGAKMKLLFGLAYADIDAKNINVTLADDHWNVKGDVQMRASLMKSTLDYEAPQYDDVNPETGVRRRRVCGIDEFKGGLSGFGVAFDLGATYKINENTTLSAAITDLGFISWKNTYKASSKNEWNFDGFDNVYIDGNEKGDNKDLEDQFDDLKDDLGDLFSVYEDGKGTEKKMLAATINAGIETTLPQYTPMRFGFLYSARIAGQHTFHEGRFSANYAPAKWVEGALSFAFTSAGCTGGLVVNLHAKHFNFNIGTDRFFSKLSKQGVPLKHMNTNLQLGISFPLN